MYKKILILLIFLLSISYVFSDNFKTINFTLEGHVPIRNNRPENIYSTSIFLGHENSTFLLNAMRPAVVHEMNFENEMIKVNLRLGNMSVSDPVYISFDSFLDNVFPAVYEQELNKVIQQQLRTRGRTDQRGLIPDIVVRMPPGAMPRAVRRIMGSEAGRLSLSGSERIIIAASRSHIETNLANEWGNNTNFDITMRQVLNLNLRGTIGEKISVNVRHNSDNESTFFDPNSVSIKYTGDEDEIFQSIEAGNISMSLSGSRYISVASSQGLFGVRSQMKFGDLSVTAVASREESQKNVRTFKGTSSPDSSFVRSPNFVQRRLYYVPDPTQLFNIYKEGDPPPIGFDSVPEGWVGNALMTTPDGDWIVNPRVLPIPGTLRVFMDYSVASDTDVIGNLINVDGSPYTGAKHANGSNNDYKFRELQENTDYTVNYDLGIIEFTNQLNRQYSIGVIYESLEHGQIGRIDLDSDIFELKLIKDFNQAVSHETWKHEVRNIYDLGMRNIRADGFLLEVFTRMEDNSRNIYVGLDGLTNMTLVRYLQMDTNGDGVIDGSDKTVSLATGRVILPFINPFYGLGDTEMYSMDNTSGISDDKYSHWFFIKGRIGRDQINLGMMILPGSVSIKINNRDARENVDFIVNYDIGTVTFLTADGRNPDSEISINYENRPLFALESRTLMGLRADWRPNTVLRLGGTLVYQSENMSDKRPRLGNEGRTLILAGVDGEVAVDTPFITTAIDFLPLINTDERSRLSLSGEVAMNLPRIRGSSAFGDGTEAWIDDMESITDSYPLGIMRPTWSPASEPFNTNLVRGRVNWFNPTNVYYRDVFPPNTMSESARLEKISVMDVKVIPPPIYTPGVSTPVWGGIMKYIGNEIDFSDREYLEILVKVDSLDTRLNQVKMYIDMGLVSEDFYVDNGGRGVLNTEDGITGRIRDGILQADEDIGLSGFGPRHPNHDPFEYFSNVEINGEFPFINGTIGNGVLDTEDLNGNGVLDTIERLIRYQVTLGDTLSTNFQSQFNGWQLYRIPLKNNPEVQYLTNTRDHAELGKISFVRMWFETEGLAKMRIVYADVVGNRWKDLPITTRETFEETVVAENILSSNNEFIHIETIDNQKSLRYTPPPRTTETGIDGDISYEQALMVSYSNIQPGHISLVNQRFREQLNLLSYNRLRYWVYVEGSSEAAFSMPDSLNVIIRLGVDNHNLRNGHYYEILKHLNVNRYSSSLDLNNWYELEVELKDITLIKVENPDTLFALRKDNNNTTFRLMRNPTLTNIRDISIGIQVPEGEVPFTGTVFFNDIRLAEPTQTVGYAARVSFDATLADFSTVRVDYEWRTADFFASTSRPTNSTNMDDRVSLNISNNYQLHKFFPVSWGLRFPLNLSQSQSLGIPRYKLNSDIIRENLSPEAQERERNISHSRSADTSLGMTRNSNSKILNYTLRNMNVSGNIREQITETAARRDTTVTWRVNTSYNLTIPNEVARVQLGNNYFLSYIPKTFNNSLNVRGEEPNNCTWPNRPGVTDWIPAEQSRRVKMLDTSNEIRYDILTDMNMSYRLTTRRNLLLKNYIETLNVGTQEEMGQNIQANYTPFYMRNLSPVTLRASADYRENRNTNFNTNTFDYSGNVNRAIGVEITLLNSNWITSIANKLGESANKRYEANTRDSGQGFSDANQTDDFDERASGFFGNNFNNDFDNDFERNFDKGFENDFDFPEPTDRNDRTERGIPNNDGRQPQENRPPPPSQTGNQTESSSGPKTFFADVVGIIGRIQNFNIKYDNSYSSRFDKDYSVIEDENKERIGERRPPFLYQLGIPGIIDNSLLPSHNVNDNISVRTGFPIVRNVTSDWSYSYQIQRTFTREGLSSQNVTNVFPDVRVNISGFERWIRADKFLTNSRLNVAYSYSERLNYSFSKTQPQSGVYTHSLNPLLGWTGNWTNTMTTTLNINFNSTENRNHTSPFRTSHALKMEYRANIGYSFTAEQGLKIPFTGRTMALRNQLSSDVTISVETEKSTTTTEASAQNRTKIKDRESTKFMITPRASYNFTRDITGGLTGSYEITSDKVRDESRNIFRLDIWVQLDF